MKFKGLFLALLAFGALSSCKPEEVFVEPVLEVSATQLNFAAVSDEKVIYITANNDWSLEADVDWLSFNQESGEASQEKQMVKVYPDDNTVEEARTGKITITSGRLTKTVSVTQAAAEPEPEPEPEPDPDPNQLLGTGTEADPYQIRTTEHMLAMRDLAPLNATTWFLLENDIDMSEVNNWIPVNYDSNFERQIHFDGNNKTISNFHYDKAVNGANYSSIFGVLYGSCRNLKVDNAHIISTNGCGVIGGYVGTTGKPALLENVTVTNSSVTNSGDRAGGICGTAKEATFRNVSFQGTVTSTYASDAKTSCFAGQTESSVVMENCHVYADFTSKGQYIGGLIGYLYENATVTMTGCSYTGDIDAQAGYVGGVIGAVKGKLTLSTTYSAGTVTSVGNYVGGLIGAAMNDGNTIANCFSTARVSAFGQQAGGLVGTTTNKLVMSDCFAAGDVYSATSGAAGIVGRVQKSSSITNCIAWNKNVASSRSANNVYASGAILGCAQEAGTYKGCYRRYDMVYVDDFLTLVDHEDCVNACPPLPSYATATHQQAYHGKAAAPDATIASLAKSLGWDESVWDFSSSSELGISIKQLGDNKIEF